MVAAPLLAELKDRLASSFGNRLRSVVLFGSEARGEAGPESDIDLLVVLDRLSNDYGVGERLELAGIQVPQCPLRTVVVALQLLLTLRARQDWPARQQP